MPEVKKKGKVLVIARFRSGSSMTQSFFSKVPNSLAYFEPCKIKSKSPLGILHSDRATLKVSHHKVGMLTLELSSIVLEILYDVYATLSRNLISQECCKLIG